MILKFKEKEIELASIWVKYLYPYLIRFLIRNRVYDTYTGDVIFISDELRPKFTEMLEKVLIELLDECYIEPTHKERSKYSTRYEKIDWRNQSYILNYRTDIVGIVGYALYYLIKESRTV